MYSQEQYLNAMYASFRVQPQKFTKEFFLDYQTISKYYSLLVYSVFDENLINRLLIVIQPYIDNKKRFRRKSIIKLLKGHLKKRPVKFKLKPVTIERLFRFYQSQILNVNSELANDLSVMIKNIELTTENIQWLINHTDESVYVLNRILRYPQKSYLISDWAKTCLQSDKFLNRSSEIMSCILNTNPTYEFEVSDNNIIAWAIFYSHLANEKKQEMLTSLLSSETADSIIIIAERLKFFDILRNIWK